MTRLWHDMVRGVLRRALHAGMPAIVRQSLALQRTIVRGEQRPRVIAGPTNQRVLVLAPHADDEAFGCGGTLARATAQGCEVRVVFLTDGRKGYDATAMQGQPADVIHAFEAKLVLRRQQEARQAGTQLGLGEPIFLGLADGDLARSPDAVLELARVLREQGPDSVFVPFPSDAHPDHQAAARTFGLAATEAGLPASLPVWAYETWTPLVANAFVDIAATMRAKRCAMAAYRSQTIHVDYPRAFEGLSTYRALAAGMASGHVEAFHLETLAGYQHLLKAMHSAA